MENSANNRKNFGIRSLLPGVILSALVSGIALVVERLELRLTGGAWIEARVVAILGGALCRLLLRRPEVFDPGIAFSAKYFLEVAIVLLGASVSAAAVAEMGLPLIAAIAVVGCALSMTVNI